MALFEEWFDPRDSYLDDRGDQDEEAFDEIRVAIDAVGDVGPTTPWDDPEDTHREDALEEIRQGIRAAADRYSCRADDQWDERNLAEEIRRAIREVARGPVQPIEEGIEEDLDFHLDWLRRLP